MAHVTIGTAHGRRYLEVRGHRVYMDSDEEVIDAIIVCGEASFFADDVPAVCDGCGRSVFQRPHHAANPDTPRICFRCVVRFASAPEC
jgi:hypothetical protein